MTKSEAVEKLLAVPVAGLAKLPEAEQRRILREGAELLDRRRAQRRAL